MRFLHFDSIDEADKWKIENGKMSIPNDTVRHIIDLASQSWDLGLIYWDNDINFDAFWITKEDFYKYLNELADKLDKITWSTTIKDATHQKTIYSRFRSDLESRRLIEKWRLEWSIVKWVLDEKLDIRIKQLNWKKTSFDNPESLVLVMDFFIDLIHLKSNFETKDWGTISEKLDDRISQIVRSIFWIIPPKERSLYKEDYKKNWYLNWEFGLDEDKEKIFGFFLNLAYDDMNSHNLGNLSKYRKYFQSIIDQDQINELKKWIRLSEWNKNVNKIIRMK